MQGAVTVAASKGESLSERKELLREGSCRRLIEESMKTSLIELRALDGGSDPLVGRMIGGHMCLQSQTYVRSSRMCFGTGDVVAALPSCQPKAGECICHLQAKTPICIRLVLDERGLDADRGSSDCTPVWIDDDTLDCGRRRMRGH